MKKLTTIFLGLLLLLSGCKKANELTKFDINYTTTATIPSSTGLNIPFNIATPDIETNTDSKFQINNTRKDKVESITLKKLELVLKSPSTGNFNFLKSIEVYINAEEIQELKAAWKEPITEDGVTKLLLDVSSADLLPFILKSEFGLRLRTVTDELIMSDQEIEINSTFTVDAKLL